MGKEESVVSILTDKSKFKGLVARYPLNLRTSAPEIDSLRHTWAALQDPCLGMTFSLSDTRTFCFLDYAFNVYCQVHSGKRRAAFDMSRW